MSFVLRNLTTCLKFGTLNPYLSAVRHSHPRSRYRNVLTYDKLMKPRPEPGDGICFRRIVHYEDKYTVKPLNTTNLAGRDIYTGRVVVGTLGGGIKHKYHWIQWNRDGPSSADEPPLEEEIIQILSDGNRSALVALVACGDELKYYLAPHGIKPGDIIKTSRYIPKIPIANPKIGDAYPLGALQEGTTIHSIERFPQQGSKLMHAAGTCATIIKKVGNKVHIKMPSKHEFILDENCLATVGRVSNIEHSSIPIGSPNRLRELGYRPRSGLWQRKDGRYGRKIRPPKTYELKREEVNSVPVMLSNSTGLPKFN